MPRINGRAASSHRPRLSVPLSIEHPPLLLVWKLICCVGVGFTGTRVGVGTGTPQNDKPTSAHSGGPTEQNRHANPDTQSPFFSHSWPSSRGGLQMPSAPK